MKCNVDVVRIRENSIQLNGWAIGKTPETEITYQVEDGAHQPIRFQYVATRRDDVSQIYFGRTVEKELGFDIQFPYERGKDYYLIADNNQIGIGVKLKKTGSTKITAKFKYRGKTYSVKTTVKVIKYSNPFKKIVVDGRDCTSDFKNKNGSSISFMGRNIKITPNKNWRVKSIYTYKPGATKMKKVKGSSVTIPTNCRAFITMENKKNKLIEKVTFDEMDTSEDPGFIF